LNPPGVVFAMGGPRAGVAPNCLLPPGPKLRLLARFARLESRSPVTSLPPEVRPGPELDMGDITAGAAWPNTLAKLLSDTKLFSDANTEDCDWVCSPRPKSV